MTEVNPEVSAELFAETIARIVSPAGLGEQALRGANEDEFNGVDLERPLARLGNYIQEARSNPETRVLYEEQVPVMEDLYDFLVTHSDDPRGRIVLPTGVGKTVLFTEFVRATGMRTLVLTPTTRLVGQTERAFNKFSGDQEIAVGKVYGGKKDESGQVTITTYASFVKHTKDKDSPYLGAGKYDLIVCDEAHHAMAPATKAALGEYEGAIKIGLTATEDYSAKKKLEHDFPHLVHKMEIREAIESRLITPFSNWTVETDTDMSNVKISSTNDYDIEELQKTVNNQLRNQLAVDMYRTYFAGQKAFFFTSGVQHAIDLAKLLRESGVRAEAIHGGLSDKKQEALIKMLADEDDENGLMVLTNDKIAAEGVDVVNVTVCFNLAPTLSYVRARQRGGRILRLDPNNPSKHAYVIDFVDKNFRKPPVLFADPSVAGAAQIGSVDLEAPEQLEVSYNLGVAKIQRSPEAVEMLANSFSEGRKDKRLPAPEGWLTISGVANFYDISVNDARKVIAKVREYVPEMLETDSGRFLARGATDGVTTYYSAELVGAMEIVINDTLNKLPPPPEGWLNTAQVSYIYGQDYVKTLRLLRHAAGGKAELRDHFKPPRPYRGNKTLYFHPDAVRKYSIDNGFNEWNGQPPEGWISETDIRDLYGANVTNDVIRQGIRRQSGLFLGNALVANGQRYFGPLSHNWIKNNIVPPKNWVTFDEVVKNTNATPEVIEEVIDLLIEKKPSDAPHLARWCFVDGTEVRYINNVRADVIAKYIDDNRASLLPAADLEKPEDRQELKDGDTIEVPHAELLDGLAVPESSGAVGEIKVKTERTTRKRSANGKVSDRPARTSTNHQKEKDIRGGLPAGDRVPSPTRKKAASTSRSRSDDPTERRRVIERISLADIIFDEFDTVPESPEPTHYIGAQTTPTDDKQIAVQANPVSTQSTQFETTTLVSARANLMRKYRR